MKQPGIFFVLFAVIYLITEEIRSGLGRKEWFARILVFGGGVILPFGMMCLLLFCAGVFREFWFWTVDYAQQYGTLVRLGDVPHVFVGA